MGAKDRNMMTGRKTGYGQLELPSPEPTASAQPETERRQEGSYQHFAAPIPFFDLSTKILRPTLLLEGPRHNPGYARLESLGPLETAMDPHIAMDLFLTTIHGFGAFTARRYKYNRTAEEIYAGDHRR
ncbi:hypothetical protein CHS0354_010960 [Potamilus streckersoni]|uniref:Uncharacterized protein n=1 Tax=Potamilus streckersoni TaxID=2493646 RepID=A0AAE0STJ3_9BIVA|nr:hypothetical protein CHS0354_010960 [Potamilus streckersoni]